MVTRTIEPYRTLTVSELFAECDRQEAMRLAPIEGKPTWEAPVERAPELLDILRDAEATHDECQLCRWYGRDHGAQVTGLKKRMALVVGWGSLHPNPSLHTSAAYDACYFKILDAIPNGHRACRFCGESCA